MVAHIRFALVLGTTLLSLSSYAVDQALALQLDRMHVKDTELRTAALKHAQAGDRAKEQALLSKTLALDAANQDELDAIVEKHGWPTIDQVGIKGMGTIFLVVQHAPLSYQLRYLPLLRKSVEAGELPKRSFALLEDRIAVREGRPQIYGTQVKTAPGITLFEVIDPANLDTRRSSVGLEPICSYLKHFENPSARIIYPAWWDPLESTCRHASLSIL